MSDVEALARHFEDNRQRLHSVALHLLGCTADADDAVQSAWLKASRADFAAVQNLPGWFTTITVRTAMDQLRQRARLAERPLSATAVLDNDPGLASPAADEQVLRSEEVDRALLVVLAPGVIRRVDAVLVPAGVPTDLRGAADVATETRRFTQRARAGAVLLIDGVPGIAIAPGGRLLAALRIEIGDDRRIHTIDIAGDPGRLHDMVLRLPGTAGGSGLPTSDTPALF